MRRRDLLRSATALAAGAALGTARGQEPARRPLRTMSYNVLALRGFPETDANRGRLERARPQMVERLALEVELYRPDILTLQECPERAVVEALAERLGLALAFFPSPIAYPGAVLTRYRIVSSQNCPTLGQRPADLFTRHFGRVVLATDHGEVLLYSVHLYPGGPGSDAIRSREVAEVVRAMARDHEHGPQSVILQGDLNHGPDGPEYAEWRAAGLVDAYRGAEERGLTFSCTEPRWRIDYVWVHGPLAERLSGCRTLNEGAFRPNAADPASFALSDHMPVLATFG